MMNKPRIGILTGGGDAPGLNGIIEAATTSLLNLGYEVVGICDGFEGIFDRKVKILTARDVHGIHAQAGTILGTSNRCGTGGREREFIEKYRDLNLKGLIAAGGDGTFRGLQSFPNEIPLIGVPKTIDNDLPGTEITFGYDTACSVVAEAIDSLRGTADAHRRIIFVETMGRTAGWIALGGGLASYADGILLPERPFVKAELLKFLAEKQARGQRGLIVCVSEGARAEGEAAHVAFRVPGSPEPDRLGGVAAVLARWVEHELNWEARHVVLGHLQRSHPPTTTDRFLTLAMGVEVARMVRDNQWGFAVAYLAGRVSRVPLQELMQETRRVPTDHRWVRAAQELGIFI